MSKTLRELEAKRATYVVQLGVQENDLRRTRDKFIEDERIILSIIGDYRLEIADLDIAIAALSPTPDFIAEQETAREQLEREPEIPAGFTKWEGGECPVPHGKIVDIICRDPDVRVGQTNQVFAHMISWANEGNAAYDIIAYRIIEAAPADEQDDASEFAESGADLIAGFDQPIGQLAVVDGQLVATLQDGTTHNVSEFAEPAHDQAETVAATSPGEVEESRDQSEDGLGSSLIAMGYGDDDAPAEHISILTGDPAIEPESGLHEERPALNEAMQDEREQPYRIIANVDDKPVTIDFATFHDATECMEELKLRSTSKAELSVLHEGENGEQDRVTLSSFVEAEPQPDGYAPVTNPEAHIQAVEAERYALATNPEADTIARAHDYYSPEKMRDRNRSVFDIFRHKREDA